MAISTPTRLTAMAMSDSQIDIIWSSMGLDTQQYLIERSLNARTGRKSPRRLSRKPFTGTPAWRRPRSTTIASGRRIGQAIPATLQSPAQLRGQRE